LPSWPAVMCIVCNCILCDAFKQLFVVVRSSLVNGVIHESSENANGDEIPDYDNLGDDDDDDDEIQYSDRFGT